ncbi:Der1-like family-domain-containing protein [Scheffersomyces amazonensis]|uniref:Der1-like family-domain-containing protein n=1 Tax=Scheffersomyces amazonensis TaxID=1078765 RepID=UPI00315D9C11
MDRIGDWITSIPPVTRYWSMLIFAVGFYSSIAPENKMLVLFIPDKAFSSQPWRLITGFCYFGDLSLELVINMVLSLKAVRYLEESYTCPSSLFPTSIVNTLTPNQKAKLSGLRENYKTLDFLYLLVQICVSLLVLVTYAFYKMNYKILSPGLLLDDSLLYIWCRCNPNLIVPLFGIINLKIAYLPLCYTLIRSILEGIFLKDLDRLVHLDFSVFTSMFAFRHATAYGVAHFWWYYRYFIIPKFYADEKLKTDLRHNTNAIYGVKKYDVVPNLIRLLVLPPWYWCTIGLMKLNRA